MRILVTGGTGYIGSHTVLTLLEAGHDVVAVDNLSNSSPEALRRVAGLAGREAAFVQADITDEDALDAVFAEHSPEAVIHSPAAMAAAWPTTVTTSRCPRTLARRTQKPFSALWKVTRSTRPASTSWVDNSGRCVIYFAALVGGPLRCRRVESCRAYSVLCVRSLPLLYGARVR